MNTIKNIIFDIGNVIVKWDPRAIVVRVFPGHENIDQLTQQLFKSESWLEINRGKMSVEELIHIYHKNLNIELNQLRYLMQEVRDSLLPIENSFELINKLHESRYNLYVLSDNVCEFMAHLKAKYNIWDKFNGIVTSYEVGSLKPLPPIYQHLIDRFQLKPNESVFIDDHLPNIEGARAMGIHGIQFFNNRQCVEALKDFGI